MNIDLHHHFIPPELLDYIEEHPDKTQARIVKENDASFVVFQQGWKVPIAKGQYDRASRKQDLLQMRLDAACLSVSPIFFFYWLDPETAAVTSRICNDYVANEGKEDPCLLPMATLPMQDPDAAIAEMKYCREELGMRAVEIAPEIGDSELDDERFFPFYDYCAQKGILIFLHPQVMDGRREYLHYYNTNLIGNVLQTNNGLNHLIFGGVFESFPNLKVLAAHGGGYFPYQFGRLMHGYSVRSETRVRISDSPEKFLKNLYFDTITHWTPALQFLVDTFGADHVVIGTDYPFDMGDLNPMDKLDALKITKKERDDIRFANAQRLLKLSGK